MNLAQWYSGISAGIAEQLGNDPELAASLERRAPCAVHLAVLVEPFLTFVLEGSKRVESRFSTVRVAPFRAVQGGDILLLKEAAGPIVAVTVALEVWCFGSLDAQVCADLKAQFGAELRDDVPGFWEERVTARYATLIRLGSIAKLPMPLTCPKSDRRGWVVLRERPNQLTLFV